MKRVISIFIAAMLILSCMSCTFDDKSDLGFTAEPKSASTYTAQANSAVYSLLDFDNNQKAEYALRGLIDAPKTPELKDSEGIVI